MVEGPYELPAGWRWVRLREVAVREAQTIRPADEPNATFVYLGMEHVRPGQWDEPQPTQVSGRDIKSQVIRFTPGMVLYGKLRPYLNKVVVPSFEGIASTEFVPIRPCPDALLPEYLGGFLRSPWFVRYANSNTTGSRQPRTRLDALWEAPIPLPPLPEQRRIVARIDELMSRIREARRLREEAIRDAERLWQSVLVDTFPRPSSDLPVGWRWVRLGEVCLPTERRDPTQYPSMPFIYVDISAVDNTEGRITSPKQMLGKDAPSRARKLIRTGDVIFATTRPYLKNIAIVGPELDGQICSTGFCVLRANRNAVEPRFLYHLCRSDVVLLQLSSRNMRGASYPAVTDSDVYNALLPLPPLPEQRRIVADLDALQEMVRALKKSQAETESEFQRLEQSVVDRAFRGEL